MAAGQRLCAFSGTVVIIVLVSLYAHPNPPKFSIEEFSFPALNKTSDHISGDICFDLKLRNMNKAIGLYYDVPSSLAFFYYPLEEPNQKYFWEITVPPFYQGNGKTTHIRSLTGMGNHPRSPSTAVVEVYEDENIQEPVGIGHDDMLAPTVQPFYKGTHVKSLLRNHLQLPSTVVDEEDDSQAAAETRRELVVLNKSTQAEVVSFKINFIVHYRFKYWTDSTTYELEVGGDVMVDANTGEKVSKGSIKLVESDAAAAGPVMLMVLCASFLLMYNI